MSWWVFKNNYFYFRILSDLQEHLRDSTESSHKSCTHFPVINIFHYCGQARQLKNQYWHIIVNESPFYTQSSLVLTQGPFSVPGSHPKYLIAFSSHVPLGLTASVSQNFLWFWWLHQSAECWAAILWNIPWLGRVWCFLLRRAGSWVWGKEEHIDIILIISWQGCTVSDDLSQWMFTLITWGNASRVFPLFSWLCLSPFPHCSLWEEVALCSPHLRGRESCSTPLRVNYLLGLPVILWNRIFSSYHLENRFDLRESWKGLGALLEVCKSHTENVLHNGDREGCFWNWGAMLRGVQGSLEITTGGNCSRNHWARGSLLMRTHI